uniref:SpaA isopeptide-forming pilin-related protein n=1 Tax=Enterococcus faecalis TaxID=1351 RepID=UPI0021C9A929
MEKRKYQKILCIFASMIMIVNQLGIIQVFAETIVPEFKLSIEESTVQVNKEFSVTASGTEEQIETFKLEENSSISELGTEKIDATHIKIHLKATEIGVYNLIGQSESGEKTKALLVTVTNSGIDDSSNKELSTIEKNNSKSIDSKKSMFESTIESTNQEAKGGVTLRAAGDDPGVEITATNPISSRSSVDLRVVMNTSAGNLDEDGHINILIPKSIVLSSSELISNLALGDPFYLGSPAVKDDGNGNYVMNIAYDHTKIDQTQAKNYEFHVKFTAPVMYIGDDHPDTVDFNTELYKGNDLVSKDTATSNTIKGKPGTPLIQKWSTRRHSSVNGVNAAILSQDNPSSNIFAITINYSGSVQKNATLVDVTPEGTQLVDPGNYIPATGDKTPINHIRIAKVTGRDSSGIPSSWEYVTSEFQGKINLTSTGFSIAFGDIGSEDAYVVMYASEVTGFPTPDEFGVRYNKVDLKSDGTTVGRAQEAVALDSNSYTATSLKKEVSSKTISTTEGELQYSLTAASDTGVIPAGTIISDPLPEYTKFIKTDEMDSEYFSDAVYNADTNTVSYTLLKDIVQKDSSTIKFTVHYKNDQALANDKISNIATYNPSGTPIRSNDGTTVLNGSAYLYKIDKDTKNPLEGAKFKIIDSNGTLVANNLTSDENGFINSGVLKPGNYEFIETQAPAGYELDETPIKFTVVEGQKTPINLTAT